MTETACKAIREDLALLAGGDVGDARREADLRTHLEDCAGCRSLFGALVDDRGIVARGVALGESSFAAEPSLAEAVVARIASEPAPAASATPGPGSAEGTGGSSSRRWMTFTRAAAVLLAVVGTGTMGGLALLDSPTGRLASSAETGPGSPVMVADGAESLPVRVRRAPGAGLDVSWAADGREHGRAGRPTTYRLLASASPRDFGGAMPVEVAGNHVVTDQGFPSARGSDRALTFFRVE